MLTAQQPRHVGYVGLPILQMRKIKLREVTCLKLWVADLSSKAGWSTQKSVHLTILSVVNQKQANKQKNPPKPKQH